MHHQITSYMPPTIMAKGKTKFYAVAAGRKPGIYSTWTECERQVKGHRGARFKSFKTREEAAAFVGGAGGDVQVARVASDSAASASTARTDFASASNSSSYAQKRPAVPSASTAPTAAKRPRASDGEKEHGVVITVYFDGGARGNPGVAGAGAVVTRQIGGEDTRQVVKIRQYCGPNATNNVAEYTGLLLGLRTAKDFAEKYVIKDSSKKNTIGSAALSLTSTARPSLPISIQMNIRGDSDLVIKQMNGQYQCKNAKLIPLYNDCRSIASQLKMMEHGAVAGKDNGATNCRISIDMAHVYRNDNKVADALANEAMDERRSWRTEFVVHADGRKEEVVSGGEGANDCEGDIEKRKGSEDVIEIV